jgi:uncharacterized protein
MSTTLYDLSVCSFVQILEAVSGFLDKGRAHCETNGIDLSDVVETRIHPDMLPFRFQIVSVAHHSLGALKGAQEGIFTPPPQAPDLDYSALQNLVTDALTGVQQFTPETVNALEGTDVEFKLGDRSMPFTAEGFLMSFSLPNFYFHATTAYDILRGKGVPIGKRDFMGRPRMKS